MDKRTFLKLSSAIMTGMMMPPLTACERKEKRKNWAGNYEYSTDTLHEPRSVEELQEVVKKLEKVKAQGTCHAFNSIADSHDNLISTKSLNKIILLDAEKRQVTVEAGIRYGELCRYLHEKGFALHNLASLPHISIAGACATATHGSGSRNGNLATVVTSLEIVTADGELVTLTPEKDKEKFHGAVVNLGALGVTARMSLAVQPAFMVRQDVYQHLPFQELENNLENIFASGYSVSLFTDWKQSTINQVWIKRLTEADSKLAAEPEFFKANLSTRNMHPIESISAVNCTEQMGVPGPWHERLPHFKMDFTPSSGEELQTEYFVPRAQAFAALVEVNTLQEKISPLLQISEVRSIAADELWMSPCYRQESLAIHFTWKKDWEGVRKVLPEIEDALAPFQVRPHWAKLFTLDAGTLRSRYSRSADFVKLVKEFDPAGKFRNEFLNRNLAL